MADNIILQRTPAVAINDIIRSTLNLVTLQSKDDGNIKVSLAPLLGKSKLIRLIVDESHLHPAIHGPLTVSCDEVSAESLVGVGEILSTGETFIRDENEKEEIKQVLKMLGIEADLSLDLDRKTYNYEYLEQHSLPDGYLKQHSLPEYEGVNLENECEMKDDHSQSRKNNEHSAQQIIENVISTSPHEETGFNDADDNETKVDIPVNENDNARDEAVQLEEEFETKDNCTFGLKANLTQSRGNNEYNEQRITFNDILTALGNESPRNEENYDDDNESKIDVNENVSALELGEGDETNLSDDVVYEANDYSIKQCCVNIENLGKFPSQSHQTNKNVKKENVAKCNICEYSTKFASQLKRHMKTHTGVKPYTCQICNSSFSHQFNFKRHIKIHTGEKQYKCQICGFQAARGDYLKLHTMSHTGERPHKCKICDFSCIQSYDLKLHMFVHTGEKIFKCKKCDYVATTKYKVQKHDKKIHEV